MIQIHCCCQSHTNRIIMNTKFYGLQLLNFYFLATFRCTYFTVIHFNRLSYSCEHWFSYLDLVNTDVLITLLITCNVILNVNCNEPCLVCTCIICLLADCVSGLRMVKEFSPKRRQVIKFRSCKSKSVVSIMF